MFDLALSAKIRAVKGVVDESGPMVVRRIRVKLEREFDLEIARGIGVEAVGDLDHLEQHAKEKIVYPISAIRAKATLVGIDGSIAIDELVGRKATAKAGKVKDDEEEEPKIEIEWECRFTDAIWLFLGRNLCATAHITLTKSQLALDLPKPEAKKNGKAKGPDPTPDVGKAPKESKRKARANGEGKDRDEAQDAETPEEAEALREERRARAERESAAAESILTQPEIERCEVCHGPKEGPHATWCGAYVDTSKGAEA